MKISNSYPANHIVYYVLFFTVIFFSQSAIAEQQPYRLPTTALPISQYIDLNLDPEKDDFSGSTLIELKVNKVIDRIGLHWKDLNIKSIVLISESSQRKLTESKGEYDIQWLSDGKPIMEGSYQLKIKFSANYSTDGLGLFRIKHQDINYLFTQFEALYARRVFPVFDEPNFKIPYQLTLTVPKDLEVVSNTPVLKQQINAKTKTVYFNKTPPMPSYLIALSVGELDKTPITGLSIPGFIYSPKGTGTETGFTIKHTPRILETLEQYFGTDYPYSKLDFVAVPGLAAGAMENPGLVTYITNLLLRGDHATASRAKNTLSVISHELAHMWYGNLVTMGWWDDLWLNEAFATWMAQKVMNAQYPQYQSDLELPQSWAFKEDGLAESKPIRKEVKTARDIEDGLNLNYTKGHAILNMLEQALGKNNFQKAIQSYMETHQWKNAVDDDLWKAFSGQSVFDIEGIAKTFLNQPGYALVSINKNGEITQKRFRNSGAQLPEFNWQIPITIKYKLNGRIAEEKLLLTDETLQVNTLKEADWLLPVANGNGYFRWKISTEKYEALLNGFKNLTDREKNSILSNSEGLLDGGEISIKEHMTLLTQLAKEDNPVIFLQALNEIKALGENHIDLSSQNDFRNYITEILTPWYQRIGSKTRKGDDDGVLQLRPRLLRTLGQFGNNPDLNKELIILANQYLEGDKNIDHNLGIEALRIAAMLDQGNLVEKYYNTYLSTSDANLKSNLKSSMYFTQEKSVAYVLEKILDNAVPASDKSALLVSIFYINKDQTMIYQWLDKHFDQLAQALPEMYQGYLPYFMASNCQEDNVRSLQSFYEAREDVYQASLKKSIESEKNCLALKKREAGSFSEFLSNYR